MSTDSFSTHSLSDCNSMILCATKTIQAMNKLNEEKLGRAPDNPGIGDIKDHPVKTRSDTEQFRKFYGPTTKVSQLIQYFIQLCQHKIYFTYTTDCPNTNPTGMPTIH